MVQLNTIIGILIGAGILIGWIVTFFVMQKGQNMNIAQLQEEIKELKRKQSLSTSNQIKTEKDLVAINIKLDHILEAIEELKHNGNHRDPKE